MRPLGSHYDSTGKFPAAMAIHRVAIAISQVLPGTQRQWTITVTAMFFFSGDAMPDSLLATEIAVLTLLFINLFGGAAF